jgi:hypothetical protein
MLFGDDISLMADDSIPRCILYIFDVSVFSGSETALYHNNRNCAKNPAGANNIAVEFTADYNVLIIYVTAAAVSAVPAFIRRVLL